MNNPSYDSFKAFVAANKLKLEPHLEANTALGACARSHGAVLEIENWFEREIKRCGYDEALDALSNFIAHFLVHGFKHIQANGNPESSATEFVQQTLNCASAKLRHIASIKYKVAQS